MHRCLVHKFKKNIRIVPNSFLGFGILLIVFVFVVCVVWGSVFLRVVEIVANDDLNFAGKHDMMTGSGNHC